MSRLFNDATPDYLRVEAADLIAAPFTVSVWFRVGSLVDASTAWWMGNSSNSFQYWAIALRTDGKVRFRIIDVSFLNIETTTTYSLDVWNHACIVEASATDHRVYLNGGGKNTSTTDREPSNSDRTSIGRSDDLTPTNEMLGELGHQAIWNVAFSDQEVASLAAKVSSSLRMRRDALVAYRPLNGQNPEIDIVGGNDMTIFGSPSVVEEPPIPNSIVAPG
jgi:hypothetical protein